MKTILLTGSNGLLGQKLVALISKHPNKYRLIATSRGENRIQKHSGFEYASLDITKINEVEAVLATYKPEVIINSAAMTNVDACEQDQEACTKLNVDAVRYLLAEAEKYQSHFIQLSTDFVFDGTAGPYREEDKPNPLSFYGQSKFLSEQLVQASATPWSIVRTIIIYGVVEDMSRSNIVLWAKSALEKKQKLSIVNDQFRSPVYAEDLADGCLRIAERKATGIYHLSGKDIMSIVELVRTVARYYKLDESYIEEISSASLNQAAKRPPKTGFILDKAIRDLDYSPHSFEEGIALLEGQLNP